MTTLRWWTTPPSARPADRALWITLAAIAGYATASALLLDGVTQAVASIALAGGLLGLARRDDCSWEEIGFGRAQLGTGLAWGLGLSAVAIALIVVAAFVPGTEDFFTDDRVADATGGEIAVGALVRIPVFTAAFEEIVFRGLLFALLLKQMRPLLALLTGSAIFGLWHVAPALGFADTNSGSPISGDLPVVLGTVAATAVAGAFLTWLRVRADSLVAPILVHWAVNASALVTAFALR